MSNDTGGSPRTGKTDGAALIVGGSGALGSAIARRLAEDYTSVFFTYRANAEGAQALVTELERVTRAGCAMLDVRDCMAVTALVEDVVARFGPLEVVVFASGVNIEQPFVSQITADQWREVVESELLGFSHVVTATLPIFRNQQRGVFINIGTFGTHSYPPGDALSAVPKAGTEVLCRALAREEGRHGIRANVVAPGIIVAGIGAKSG